MASRTVRTSTPFNIQNIPTPAGRTVSMMDSQVAGGDSRAEFKYSSFQTTTVVPSFLKNQAIISFLPKIQNTGTIVRAWLQLVITVANAPVQTLPPFMWLDVINAYKDSSNSSGRQAQWFALLASYANYLPSQFGAIARGIHVSDVDAWSMDRAIHGIGDHNIFIPLLDVTFLTDATGRYYPTDLKIDFQSPSQGVVEIGNVDNITLTNAFIITEEMAVTPKVCINRLLSKHIGKHMRGFPQLD